MRNTSNTAHAGQSHTLHVSRLPNGHTRVEVKNLDIAPVEDADERFAVQQMRRALEDLDTQGSRPLTLPGDAYPD